jgi:CubicO group peptidase (beta-lactamase class C family)
MENPVWGPGADVESLADRLTSLPTIVGAQVAVVSREGVSAAAGGILDLEAPGRPVVAESLFRPGSITKLLTATLVMQCVDDGLVALDDPVTAHVPEFRLAAAGDADRVEVGHLLAHSSGIDAGDLFVDTGEGDDALARYVDLLGSQGLLFEPGRWMSYCNAGFVLAGHLLARVRGASWEDVASERILGPLGMSSTVFLSGTDAEGVGARGHLVGPGGPVRVPTGTLSADPMCTRGLAPAGATLTSTAADLARFAAVHVGLAEDGAVLSDEAAATMRRLWAPAPGGVTKMAGMGLGWQVWRGEATDAPLRPRIGGANPGQSGLIACDPERASALVVLTNSDQGVNAVSMLLDGVGPAAVPDDEPARDDLAAYCGTFGSHAMNVTVQADGAGALQIVVSGIQDARVGAMRLPGAVGDLTYPLTAIDRTTFASPLGPIAFIDRDDAGRPRLLRWRMRALHRVD